MKKNKMLFSIIVLILIAIISGAFIVPLIKNVSFGLDLKGGFEVLYQVSNLDGKGSVSSTDLSSTYKSIQNRIDTLGVSEPEIILEGDKIRVKLPGVTNEEAARDRLSTPAVLTFRNNENEELMNSSILVSGKAKPTYDDKSMGYVVAIDIKDNDTFYRVTKDLSEKTGEENRMFIWLDFEEGVDSATSLSECSSNPKCISAPGVPQAFSGNVVITGLADAEAAQELADLINSGSLPTKLTEISTKSVDASFGNDTLKLIAIAGVITFVFISLILIVFYRLSGVVSSVCLLLYITLVFTIFNLIDGVLTLTGIAALILGIGMAVDSNIITLEKIKEEVSSGKSLIKAYKEGNKRSLVSLLDANITTFIASVVLFVFGESSVKGFATMLIITIFATMISCVLVSRFIMNKIVESKKFDDKINSLLGKVKSTKERNYLKVSKFNVLFVLIVSITGAVLILTKGLELGIDFRGGSSLTVVGDNVEITKIDDVLSDYSVIEKEKVSNNEAYYKINEVLNENEMKSLRNSFSEINYKSNISVISNTVKKDLTKNAIKALIIASVAILVYIGIRFASSYGISSIIAIISDCLVTLGIFAIFRIEVNFIFVAGILTIIGYSINDTIVVFDLVRENYKNHKKNTKEELSKVVNESIRLSLKRNILTSVTTLSAIVILLCIGISSIKEFNITVLIGLLAGTFSSLFIAPYIWIFLESRKDNSKPKDEEEDGPKEKIIKGING